MRLFESDVLEPRLTQELIDDIAIHYQASEKALVELDRYPNNAMLVQQLFRAVHNIKSDLGIVGFAPLMPLINALEDLLMQLKQTRIQHSPLLGDLMLLMLDDARTFVEDFQRDGSVAYDEAFIASIAASIEKIQQLKGEPREQLIAETIRLLDPAVAEVADADATRMRGDDFLHSFELSKQQDLAFFRDLMAPVEARSKFWAGRSDRILKMSMSLNAIAGHPVDDMNLAIAVYVHDFGMAFIPVELLHKEVALSESEMMLMRSHVQSSSQLLQNMPRWKLAKDIVAQHHEAVDGSGYPLGLRSNQICEGAKIIAIADSFDALTHQRAYSSHQKRPIIRAVKEINACAAKQFCPYWVDIFNQAIRSVLSAHRKPKNLLA